MIKIKQTKSIEMWYGEDTKEVYISIGNREKFKSIAIPMKVIFQVQRGITSAIARFYRKHEKRS